MAVSQVFFSSSHFSLHLNFPFVFSLLFFSRSFWSYHKNENFWSASRTNGAWRWLQSADGTGFQRREDVSYIRCARRCNATISHEVVADVRVGAEADDAKIGVTFVADSGLCRVITRDCALSRLVSYVESTRGIWCSVDMPLRYIFRIDVVCGG